MVLYPNKLPESERVCSGICREGNAFKSANRNILNILAKLEDSFTSRLENECIIDPIAIYREL